MHDNSVFHTFTSKVLVREIQSPIFRRHQFDTPMSSMCENMFDDIGFCSDANLPSPIPWISLIEQDSDVVGYVDWKECPPDIDFEANDIVAEFYSPLTASSIITGDSTLFDAVASFGRSKRSFYLVLNGQSITGVLHYSDLFKPLGRLGFFSLVQELETAALDLCLAFPDKCFPVLSQGRQAKAIDVFKKKLSQQPKKELDENNLHSTFARLVESTTLIDKAKMINKCKLVHDHTPREVGKVFNLAEPVRNACAHPARDGDLEGLLSVSKLNQFVHDCLRLIESLRLVIPS